MQQWFLVSSVWSEFFWCSSRHTTCSLFLFYTSYGVESVQSEDVSLGRGLLLAGGLRQLIGQDMPALHPPAFVLQAVHPVAEGVALRVTAQTDAT